MIINSVKLQNIRSYINNTICFPAGSVMLSGDVGAGKSTILLAVEFALFGILRGSLEGNALLRNGKNSGFVEVSFSVDGKDVVIKRALKRNKEAVTQDAGYIIIDGLKREGTAVELKSAVLDLLGYPKELLTKSKALIYRYTVYTPQEEMKQILLDERGYRLDTLRKVFQIDKYKRIRENAIIVVRSIKEKIKGLEGQISDLELKREQKEKLAADLVNAKKKIEEFVPKISDSQQKIKDKRNVISEIERRMREFNELKSSINVLAAKLKEKTDVLDSIIAEANEVNKKILEFNQQAASLKPFEEPFVKKVAFMRKKIAGLNEKTKAKEDVKTRISSAENDLNRVLAVIKEHEVLKETAEKTKRKIAMLDKCPTCMQPVSPQHKQRILEAEEKRIAGALKTLEGRRLLREEITEELSDLKKQLDTVLEQEKLLAQLKPALEVFEETINELNLGFPGETFMSIKEELPRMSAVQKKLKEQKNLLGSLMENEEKKKRLIERQAALSNEIAQLKTEQDQLKEKQKTFENIEDGYLKEKNGLEALQLNEKNLLVEKAAFDKELENINNNLKQVNEEIERKSKAKQKLSALKKNQSWFEDFFMNLMGIMEKQIMLRVYNEFNALFQEWFSVLMEDETISARLDEEFCPVVEQNGYETNIQNLSGGERTSCALAYRLALNKVINDLITGIKTKDLIILDEPTDGFSSEQLEKVRDVIDQLRIKQVVLVSHESKIESFVGNVIKIEKQEHMSSVV